MLLEKLDANVKSLATSTGARLKQIDKPDNLVYATSLVDLNNLDDNMLLRKGNLLPLFNKIDEQLKALGQGGL